MYFFSIVQTSAIADYAYPNWLQYLNKHDEGFLVNEFRISEKRVNDLKSNLTRIDEESRIEEKADHIVSNSSEISTKTD